MSLVANIFREGQWQRRYCGTLPPDYNNPNTVLAHMQEVAAQRGDQPPTAILTSMGINYPALPNLHRGCFIGADRWLYTIPRDCPFFTRISPNGHTVETGTYGLAFSTALNTSGGAMGADGVFYSPPRDGSFVLKIDTSGATPVASTATFGLDLSGDDKWTGAVRDPVSGRIYAFPTSARDFLIIDPAAGTAIRSDLGLQASFLAVTGVEMTLGSLKWIGGCLGLDGKIYATGYSGHSRNTLIVIDPATNTAIVSTFDGQVRTGFTGMAMGADGKHYCAPRAMSEVQVLDTLAGTVSRHDYGLNWGALGGDPVLRFTRAVAGGDGRVYFTPEYAHKVLVYDTITGTAEFTDFGLDLTAENKFIGGTLHVDGKIYCPPKGIGHWLVIDPGLPKLRAQAAMSPLLNKGT